MGANDEALTTELTNLIASCPPGWTLPQPFYRDAEIYRVDVDRIWRRGWLFAGYTCQVPEPGDFFVYEVDTDALIVMRDDAGRWMDDNGGDWTEFVTGAKAARSGRPVGWKLVDHDLAVIDTDTLSVRYVGGLMNICMALAVNPGDGRVSVVGTDATNDIRYEPVLTGRFLRVMLGIVSPVDPIAPAVTDLNPHLDYLSSRIPQAQRDRSIGDPRGMVWNRAGTRAYVTGMGSNNVVVVGPAGQRAGLAPTIKVGAGPTGVVLDEDRSRLYVLNRFDGSIYDGRIRPIASGRDFASCRHSAASSSS